MNTEIWLKTFPIPPLTATLAIDLLKSRCVSPTSTDFSWIFSFKYASLRKTNRVSYPLNKSEMDFANFSLASDTLMVFSVSSAENKAGNTAMMTIQIAASKTIDQ